VLTVVGGGGGRDGNGAGDGDDDGRAAGLAATGAALAEYAEASGDGVVSMR
jgi:hypothetical protein